MGYKIIEYKEGDKLFTAKGIETNWIFIKDVKPKEYLKQKRRIVRVRCSCGREKEVQYNNIRTGKSMCCGLDPCKIPFNKNNRSVETSYNSLYYNYNKGAISRNLEFDLSKEEFKKIIGSNCNYCGSEPSQEYKILNSKNGEVRAGIPIIYNGIDRVDNSQGYTKENSVTCCWKCNKMKSTLGHKEFISQVNKISNFLKKLC